jgi:aspartate kinase
VKVVKFGGSSLADAAQFRKVRDIIASDPERRIVVVSAPGKRSKDDVKVTDMLIQCARIRLDGRDAGGDMARIIQRYEEIAGSLGMPSEVVSQLQEDLCRRLEGDTSHPARFEDEIKSLGEDYCARLMAAFLSETGVAAEYVSPKDAGLIVTEEYGNAQVLEESYSRLAALKSAKSVVVFPGFFGHSREGHVVTFSRGGSDLTGAVLAVAVRADVYENYTDMDGIAAADPRIVNHPVLIRELTYQELRELSYGGFTVFHEEAMLPVLEAGIPINVRNTNNPSHPGTWVVVSRKAAAGGIVGVACDHGFCGIYVDKYLMNREKGFGRKLLQIIEDEDLSFDHAPSGVDNMTVVLPQAQLSGRVLDRIKDRIYHELGADHVRVENDISLLSVVGDGMRHTVGIAARVTGAIAAAGGNIELIVQGPSELTMILGVKQTDAARTVDAIYREFYVEQRIHLPGPPSQDA